MFEANLISLLLVYGPLGIIVGWFMFRLEKVLLRLAKSVNLNSLAIIRWLEHNGLHEEASKLSKDLYRINGESGPGD